MTATNVLPMEVARKPPRAKSQKTPRPVAARAEKRAMAKASAKEIQARCGARALSAASLPSSPG
jgi:hypothetical protein